MFDNVSAWANMDESRFLNACKLRDKEKYNEAFQEFLQLAETEAEPLDKAIPLLHAINTLEISGQLEAATDKLSEVRALMHDHPHPEGDEKFEACELFLDYEVANLLWLRGGNAESALTKFDAAIEKHKLEEPYNESSLTYKGAFFRDFYESIQMRRAFILANLGRWKEALPILRAIDSPREYKESVAFYLGHCYANAGEYIKAKPYLVEALNLGLPPHLEYRAHFELGIVYMAQGGFARAKIEFEKTLDTADADYLKGSSICKRLEICCRQLGLQAEAKHYAQMKG